MSATINNCLLVKTEKFNISIFFKQHNVLFMVDLGIFMIIVDHFLNKFLGFQLHYLSKSLLVKYNKMGVIKPTKYVIFKAKDRNYVST